MQTILITGGSLEKREEKTQSLITQLAISPFDTFFLKTDLSIGIEDVRNLKEQLILKSFSSANRALIIYNVEKATLTAQNALLKTLEEPPPNTYIIMTVENIDLLLPTIISRAQVIKLPLDNNFQNQDENLLAVLTKLPTQSIGEKFILAQKYGTKKDEALLFLNNCMKSLQNHMKTIAKGKTQANNLPILLIVDMLKKIREAATFIERNINPRLTLEILFLGFTDKKNKKD